jgi:hypothetical protein
MSREPGDTASQLQELISRALRQQVRSNQRFADLLRRIASGELSGQQVREEFRHFSEAEAAEYVRSLANLGISFFSHLLELNQGFNERFFERVVQNGNGHEAPEPEAKARISLHGEAGATVKAAFVVENRRDQASDVALVFSKVKCGDGTGFQAPFVAEPAAFRLSPGEERSVQISLMLHPELFAAGQTYSSSVMVRGPEDMLVSLDLRVDAAVEPHVGAPPVAEPAAPVAPKKKPRKAAAVNKSVKRAPAAHAAKARSTPTSHAAKKTTRREKAHRQTPSA